MVREISNGALQLDRQGFDERSNMRMFLVDNDTGYLGAEVTVESGSLVSTGATAIARLDEFDNLIARAFVDRSDNADESLWTPLYSHNFATTINFDEDYSLFIEFTGSELIFTCDGERVSYNITTPTYEHYHEFRGLRSIVYLDSGESGSIKARFDNVYVD